MSGEHKQSIQLQMSYHLRVPMGKLMSMLSDKARQNQEGNTTVTSSRQTE